MSRGGPAGLVLLLAAYWCLRYVAIKICDFYFWITRRK